MSFSSSPFTSPARPGRDGAKMASASHGTQKNPISFDDDDDLATDASLSPSPYFTQPTQVVNRPTLSASQNVSKTGTQPTQITNRPIVGLGHASTEISPSRSDGSVKSISSSSPNKIEVPRSSPFKSSPPFQKPAQQQRQRILGGMSALAPAGTAFQKPTVFNNKSIISRAANESPPLKRKMSASSDELNSGPKFPIRPDSSSPERETRGDIQRSSFQPRQTSAPITMAMKLTREFEERYDPGTQLKAKKLSRRFSDKSIHLLHYARAIKLKNGDMEAAYQYMVKNRSSANAPSSSPATEPTRSRLLSKGHLTTGPETSSRTPKSRSPSPAPTKRRRLIRKGNLGSSVVPLISLVDSTDDEEQSASNDKSDGGAYDSKSESEADATDTENKTASRPNKTTDAPVVGAKRVSKILQYLGSCTVEDLAANAKISKDDAKYLLNKRPFHTIAQLKAIHKFKTTSRKKTKVDLGEDVFENLYQHVKRLDAIDRIIQVCDGQGMAINAKMGSWKMNKLGKMKTTHANAMSTVLPFPKEPELVKSNLYEYQLFGMNWMWELYKRGVGGILADDMGLGKTCQTIAFMALLVQVRKDGLLDSKAGPNLVVVPPSVLDNWQNEFVKFAPGLTVIKYSGSPMDRDELAREILDAGDDEYDVILTSYTQMSRSRDTSWMNKIGINAAVFDEGHQLKNSQTLKYKELIRINANWKLLITGTPIQNNIMEMMSLLSFVSPQFFTRDQETIEQLFSQKASLKEVSEGATLLSDRIQRARSILEPFILQRKKDQVLSMLPPKTRKIIYCDMLPRQKAQYDITSADSCQAFLGGRVDSGGRKNDKNNPWVQLRKAATHPMLFRRSFDDEKCEKMARILMDRVGPEELQQPSLKHLIAELKDGSDFKLHLWCRDYKCLRQFDCHEGAEFESGKVQKLLELIREYQKTGDRVLVFSRFEAVLDILEECLHKEGINYRLIEGRTPVLDRQKFVDEFQEDKSIPVFLLTTVAGGMGINLTGANKIVIFDQSDNPQQDVQAENRAHRLGQEKEVEVIRFITKGTIDELIYKACQKKLELAGHITGFNEDISDDKDAGLVAEVTKQLLKGEGGGSTEGYITPPKSDV
ncbi:DNA-dependent ATPase fun30 [Gnomoniopsis sp. IMI 355080]|nr:DNA-dependent ATPase fun30 [Gnomoniopsis sp. IMI 355080]